MAQFYMRNTAKTFREKIGKQILSIKPNNSTIFDKICLEA